MILHFYFARRFLNAILGVLFVFLLLIYFVDVVEHLRQFSNTKATFAELLTLAALNTPTSIYRILPLIIILAAIVMFLGLARSSELVVTRAAGRSAMRALTAPLAVALGVGVLTISVLNPIVAGTSKAYEARVEALRGDGSVLSFSKSGLWLRQGNGVRQTVIHARGSNLDGTGLRDVTFFAFDLDTGPIERIAASSAQLVPGAWIATNAKIWPLDPLSAPEAEARLADTLEIPSTLTAEEIRDSFGAPSSIPIWELPAFISRMQTAGFSAQRHLVWFHAELASPAFYLAMVLIAAVFTLRHQRGGRTGLMVLLAVLCAFLTYFVRNFSQVLGENGDLPVLLAVWAPILAAIGFSLGLLLHNEDG